MKNDYQKDLADTLTFYKNAFNLNDWDIKVVFLPHDSQECGATKSLDVESKSDYKAAMIRVYPALEHIHEADPLEFKECIAHELMHLVLSELEKVTRDRFVTQDQFISAIERTTVSLARILIYNFKPNDDKNPIYQKVPTIYKDSCQKNKKYTVKKKRSLGRSNKRKSK